MLLQFTKYFFMINSETRNNNCTKDTNKKYIHQIIVKMILEIQLI